MRATLPGGRRRALPGVWMMTPIMEHLLTLKKQLDHWQHFMPHALHTAELRGQVAGVEQALLILEEELLHQRCAHEMAQLHVRINALEAELEDLRTCRVENEMLRAELQERRI